MITSCHALVVLVEIVLEQCDLNTPPWAAAGPGQSRPLCIKIPRNIALQRCPTLAVLLW